MNTTQWIILAVAVLALALLVAAIRVFKQYERGVQFRLGKLKDGPRGPGLVLIIPVIDRIQRVSLRIVTMPIQHTVDEALSETERINEDIRRILDVQTEEWGVEDAGRTQGHPAPGEHEAHDLGAFVAREARARHAPAYRPRQRSQPRQTAPAPTTAPS